MAKILVADDNSNIQKMVGLALKDHGIEVVAVGNGEAAVRKISDIRPDLVLADVFMPVRNGYEVCQYVKEDPALSHIPVILLVGAFDPLDEQEAQRVGADGVLKKPFVPPDPLISMVKAALVRVGVAHPGFTPAPAQIQTRERVPAPAEVPAVMALPTPPVREAETESFVGEIPAHVSALKIDPGSQPLAFGSLLETPSTVAEEEPAVVTTAKPENVPQRDWRALGSEEEEEATAATSAWRRDAGEEHAAGEPARPAQGWRGTPALEEPDARNRPEEAWTTTRGKQDLTEAGGAQESVNAIATATQDASPMAPFAGDAWAEAIATGSRNKTAVAETEKPVEEAEEIKEQESPVFYEAAPAVTREPTVPEPEPSPYSSTVVGATETPATQAEKLSTASSWFSTSPSPLDAEADKATQPVSTWDVPMDAVVVEASASTEVAATISYQPMVAPDEIEVVSEAAASTVIPAAAVETIRQEASQAVEYAAQEADKTDAPAEAKEATPDAPAHVDMDAIVARVLARMNPGMLQELTREILKPVVEAIAREELNSKKP